MALKHSDAIEVKRVRGKGRGVFARRLIRQGEVNQHHRSNRWYEEGPLKGPSEEFRVTPRLHLLRRAARDPCPSDPPAP